MLFPAVHEPWDEPADVAVREPPRGGRDESDVEVERVGRVGVPEEYRHRLYVLAPGEVDGREGVAQGVGPRAGEPRLPDERVPPLLERVVAPGVARLAQKRRRAPEDEPHLVEGAPLLHYPRLHDRRRVPVERDRAHRAVGLGVVLYPPRALGRHDPHLRVVPLPGGDECPDAQGEHLLRAHACGEQDEHGHLGHAEGEGRRLLEEHPRLVLHQRVDEGPALPEALGEEALLGDVAPDVLAVDGVAQDLAHELEHLGLHRRPGDAHRRERGPPLEPPLLPQPLPVLLLAPPLLERPLLGQAGHREHAALDVLGDELFQGDRPYRLLGVLQVAPLVGGRRGGDHPDPALDVPLRVLPEGHRRPGGGVERAAAPRLEREAEDRVLLLLEGADLPFEVDLLVEGEHHAGELLLPAEMAAVLLGDADSELVGGGARVLPLAPRGAAPRGRLVEVVRLVAVEQLHGAPAVRRTAGLRGLHSYIGSSAGRASARATSCPRGSPSAPRGRGGGAPPGWWRR